MKDGELKKFYICLFFVINIDNYIKNKFNMNLFLRKFCLVFKINFMKFVLLLVFIYLIFIC